MRGELFSADMACAFILSATTLLLPLCASYITKNILQSHSPNMLNQIYAMGAAMLGLVVIHTLCNTFVDYQGHMMGTLMESDMRLELFEHYQKLSFGFYDEQRTGQLMTRITTDLMALSEFVMTWMLCALYVRAARRWDKMEHELLAKLGHR